MEIYEKNLAKLSPEQLKNLLREAKLYRSLVKQLGKRWALHYQRQKQWVSHLVVDYFSWVGENLAWEQASQVYKKVFDVNPKKEEITFREKDSLKGWIKVYLDDKMVDLSYAKIEKQIK